MWSRTTLQDYFLFHFSQIIASQWYSKVCKQTHTLVAYLPHSYLLSLFYLWIIWCWKKRTWVTSFQEVLVKVWLSLWSGSHTISCQVLTKSKDNILNRYHSNQCWSQSNWFFSFSLSPYVYICAQTQCKNKMFQSSEISKNKQVLCTELSLPSRCSKYAGHTNSFVLRIA